MGVTTDQRTALRSVLDTIAEAPAADQRQWERETFAPTLGTPWLRETLAPYASSLESVPARGGLVEHESLYLLDLMVPAGEAADVGDAIADAIVDGYWPGQVLHAPSGQAITILESKRAKAEPDLPNWFLIPITIQVRANTRNPD